MAAKKQKQQKKMNQKRKDLKRTPKNKKTARRSKSQGQKTKVSVQQVQQLKQKLQELQKKNAGLSDQYLRAEAEMQNVQKHDAKDQAQILKYSGQKLAKGILPELDNLGRALAVKVTDPKGQQLKQGVQMVYKRLQKALANNHIYEVKVAGKKFDPQYAEAVQTVAAGQKHPAGQVVKVLQKGYRLHDRILRPAMVIVAK